MFTHPALSILFGAIGLVVDLLGILRHAQASATMGARLGIIVLGPWVLLVLQESVTAVFPTAIAVYQAVPVILASPRSSDPHTGDSGVGIDPVFSGRPWRNP